MKIERTKNTIRSAGFGFGYRIVNMILPFIARTAVLYILGEQYLGLSSLFTSILSFLSLAELGMGAAMVFSMYRPIAENDNETICALLNLYRKFYRIVGGIILGVGLILVPVLPHLIEGSIPQDVNLYVLYLIYLVNTVLTYFLFGYKQSILQAHQRNDVESKIGMVIVPVSYAIMIGAMFITHNYYAYVIWLPIFTIITNIIRLIYVNRHYPQFTPVGEIDKELKQSITKKVKALIGTKLNTVVINAADNIVMAAFLGLTTIAIYGNYYYIFSAIVGFLGIVYSSMTAGIGNSLATDSLEKNYADFKKFSFINAWLIGWCSVCLICLYQPFMDLWVGKGLMFSMAVVIQFGAYFYVYQIRRIPIIYKDAAGIWWEDRFRPYVCMSVNVVLNIILVQIIGVSGIILSTIFSLCISIPWENYTIFKYVFNRSSKEYYLKLASYLIVTIAATIITFWMCSFSASGLLPLILRFVICAIVPNAIFMLIFRKTEEFKGAMELVTRIVKRRL